MCVGVVELCPCEAQPLLHPCSDKKKTNNQFKIPLQLYIALSTTLSLPWDWERLKRRNQWGTGNLCSELIVSISWTALKIYFVALGIIELKKNNDNNYSSITFESHDGYRCLVEEGNNLHSWPATTVDRARMVKLCMRCTGVSGPSTPPPPHPHPPPPPPMFTLDIVFVVVFNLQLKYLGGWVLTTFKWTEISGKMSFDNF